MISDAHQAMLEKSGIMLEHAIDRGYETITESERLRCWASSTMHAGLVPGLLVPVRGRARFGLGVPVPSRCPRVNKDGRAIKYETPWHQYMGIDIPLDAAANIDDPTVPLFITEGSKKADCAALHGLCCVALLGVWGFRARNPKGGIGALGAWNDVVLNGRRVIISYDGDLARKPSVAKAVCYLAEFLKSRKAVVEFLHLPDETEKVGIDDFLMSGGHTVQDLWRLVRLDQPPIRWRGAEKSPEPESKPSLSRWSRSPWPRRTRCSASGWARITTSTRSTCAWPLSRSRSSTATRCGCCVVSGPGNAKTETVQAAPRRRRASSSAPSSREGALLSATPERERSQGGDRGLLRKLGDRGVLVIKDVTSILSMNRDIRGQGARRVPRDLRRQLDRNVGTEGGRTLAWTGRVAVIGAVTTAWDTRHAVIATMGDRFVLLRMDSSDKDTRRRRAAGHRQHRRRGHDAQGAGRGGGGCHRRDEHRGIRLTEAETEHARRGGRHGHLGAHRRRVRLPGRRHRRARPGDADPVRQAAGTDRLRGGVAIGMDRVDAMRLAIRCARDSMPPLRLAIIDDLAKHPHSSTQRGAEGVDKPRTTVDRQLQALQMLGVVTCDEVGYGDQGRNRWFYSLAADIDPTSLDPKSCPEK